MYNSFIIGFLVKIWDVFVSGYEYSLVKKTFDIMKRFISFLFKGSVIKDIFTEDKGIILRSSFYKIYSWILEKAQKIFKNLNKYIKNLGQDSTAYNNIDSLFKNDMEIIRTISVFFLFFGVGIIINNLRLGFFSGRSYIISIILIIGSLVILSIGNHISEVLNNSYCYNFIKNLFIIDEGGEQWW